MARSAALLQALEVGTCRIAGHLPALEAAAVTWNAGQHQPAALVVAHDVLVHAAGQRVTFGSPLESARRHERGAVTPMSRYLSRKLEWPEGRTS